MFELVEGGSLQPALPRESLIQLLQSSPSFFAIAGYTLIIIQGMYVAKRATIIIIFVIIGASGSESSSGLFDVPLLSWVMVSLGILSSLVFLTKPVWWDRYVDPKFAMTIQYNITYFQDYHEMLATWSTKVKRTKYMLK